MVAVASAGWTHEGAVSGVSGAGYQLSTTTLTGN